MLDSRSEEGLAACYAGIPFITRICKGRVDAVETWPIETHFLTQVLSYCGIASQLQERINLVCQI